MSNENQPMMNRVPVLVRNPAFIDELEPDGDGVEPADPAPSISEDDPVTTVPAPDDEEAVGEVTTGGAEVGPGNLVDMYNFLGEIVKQIQAFNTMQGSSNPSQPPAVPDVNTWDTGKTIEQEYRMFPNLTRKGLKDRMDNQIWGLLQLMQERVDQGTCNDTDIRLIKGLKVISVLHARLSVITEIALRHRARRP